MKICALVKHSSSRKNLILNKMIHTNPKTNGFSFQIKKMSGWFALFQSYGKIILRKNHRKRKQIWKIFLNSRQHTKKLYQMSKVSTVSWLLYSWYFFIIFFVTVLSQASKGFQTSLSHFLFFSVVSSLLMSWSSWMFQHYIDGFKVWQKLGL